MRFTLLTDFGQTDTYVGQMKGVLSQLAPEVPVVDLTHEVEPQNVLAAAIKLDSAVDAFDEETIHIAVVDPGVGTDRRGIAVRFPRGTLVGPDNGIFTAVFERYPPTKIISLDDTAFMREPISDTFHGRDVFAPVAAHLARGIHLTELGEEVTDPVQLDLPKPRHEDQYLVGQALLADHFGNLITNLRQTDLRQWLANQDDDLVHHAQADIEITIAGQTIDGLGRTFADAAPGTAVAYLGSGNRLEIAVRNASAAQTFNFTRTRPSPVTLGLSK